MKYDPYMYYAHDNHYAASPSRQRIKIPRSGIYLITTNGSGGVNYELFPINPTLSFLYIGNIKILNHKFCALDADEPRADIDY